MIINTNTLNIRVPNVMKQILLDNEGQMGPKTIIVGDFNTPLSPIDKAYRKKVSKESSEYNYIAD